MLNKLKYIDEITKGYFDGYEIADSIQKDDLADHGEFALIENKITVNNQYSQSSARNIL